VTAQPKRQAERFDDRICGVCARAAAGIGHAPRSHQPVIWLCDDPDCIHIARNSYHMKQEEFSRLEAIAAHEARFDVGDYLAKIGKTDLTTMTLEEAMKMCQITVAAYRKNLKKLVDSEAPF
jgi:hypothetical protein